MTTEETVLAAVLRGDETRWPFTDDQAAQAFLDAVARHGIQPLITRQIRRGILLDAPARVQQSLARGAVQHAAVEGALRPRFAALSMRSRRLACLRCS